MECNSANSMWVSTWRQEVSGKIPKKVNTAFVPGGVDFAGQLQSAKEAKGTTGVENYRKYLEKKYGNVTVQSIGKDRERALQSEQERRMTWHPDFL